MYLTFEEYEAYFPGVEFDDTFKLVEFPMLAMQAEALINYRTFNRLVNDTECPKQVKDCVVMLINLIIKQNALLGDKSASAMSSGDPLITSQSNDGVSISYAHGVLSTESMSKELKLQISNAISSYLWGVRNQAGRLVLYLGVYPDE